jgi:GntR family transcriptional regulator, galactonate operon transcriptional repressor
MPAPRQSKVVQLPGQSPATADRLFNQIVDTIAIGIVSGHFAAGALLPNEGVLGGKITVSRTAHREAIKYLSAKGLIEAKRKSGTRVRPRTDWNLLDPDILRWSLVGGATRDFVRDLFELRRTIEPDAVRFAAARRTDEQLLKIENALIRMETLKPMSTEAIAADIEFHERIFEASGNQALSCLKGVVSTTILWSQNLKRQIGVAEFKRSLRDHRRIYEAIAAGDGELAAAHAVLLVADALNSTVDAMHQVSNMPIPLPSRPIK